MNIFETGKASVSASVAIATLSLFIGGCAHTPMQLAKVKADGYEVTAHSMSTDAKSRYLFVTSVPGPDGKFYPMVCSEPQPDAVVSQDSLTAANGGAAMTAAASELLGSIAKARATGANTADSKSVEGGTGQPKADDGQSVASAYLTYVRKVNQKLEVLSQRTVSLQFLRESMFRLCEMTVNTAHLPQREREIYLETFISNVQVAAEVAKRLDENLALVGKLDTEPELVQFLAYKKELTLTDREKAKSQASLAQSMRVLQDQEKQLAQSLEKNTQQQSNLSDAIQANSNSQEKLTGAMDKLAGGCPAIPAAPPKAQAKKSVRAAALCPQTAAGAKATAPRN